METVLKKTNQTRMGSRRSRHKHFLLILLIGFFVTLVLWGCSKTQMKCPPCPPGDNIDKIQFARRVKVGQLEGVETPSGITTAELKRRTASREQEVGPGIRIITRCSDNWCVDGLQVDGRTVIAPSPSLEEKKVYQSEGEWLEQVIRVAWESDRYISIYIARSEFSGGAHANNTIICRTYRRAGGKLLSLEDVLPAVSANRLLNKARDLFNEDKAFDVLGDSLNAQGFELKLKDFRFERTAEHRGENPEIILCAQGPYPSGSAELLELRVEAFPVAYLLE